MATVTEDDVAKAVEDFLNNIRGFDNAIRAPIGLRDLAIRLAAAEALAEFGSTAGAVVEALVEIIADLGGWILVLGALSLLAWGYILESVLVSITSKLPWIGGSVTGIVHQVFRPIDNTRTWLANQLSSLSTHLIINFFLMLRHFLQFELGTTSTGGTNALQAQVNHEQSEINDIYRRLAHLQDEISNIHEQTNTVILPTPGYQSLQQRVTHLEHRMPVIAGDLNWAHAQISQLQHDVGLLQGQVTALRSALSGVRTETLGVQDVLDQLQQTTVNLTHDVAVLGPEVDANKRQLRFLSPLGLLLVNGTAGLRNLEKLERKPCQCAGLPGLPLDDGLFLAAYEFITNG